MNSNKGWDLQIDSRIYKRLKKVPRKDSERIFSMLNSIQQNPFLGDIRKMEREKNVWRRRIGAYRIF